MEPKTRLTDMKLSLDAQFAVENQALQARDGEVNNPTGFRGEGDKQINSETI